jgi:branched-chain amino acid transport system substrate-binding protein
MTQNNTFSRRKVLKGIAAGSALGALGFPAIVRGQASKIKIGLMLPYSGTFSIYGEAITNSFRMAMQENAKALGGREIEYVRVDDESDPAKATDNINRLVTRDKVDVVIGTVHSGVAAGMLRVTKESGVLHIIPNAGLAQATGALCAPNIFRTSFSNWQAGYGMGAVMAKRPSAKNVVTLSWRYAAGEESVKGFKDGFLKGGGKIGKELWLPFPNVEFQPLLTEVASIKPDAVYSFIAGAAGAKYMKDYVAAGISKNIPLIGPGFLTEGLIDAAGTAAEGIETVLHYADGLNTKRDNEFRLNYAKTFKLQPDVFAVQGYDAGLLLAAGLAAAKGDVTKRKEVIEGMRAAKIDSPRGAWRLSKAHNPVQDMYLRKVVGKENRNMGLAIKALDDDPSVMALCKMNA